MVDGYKQVTMDGVDVSQYISNVNLDMSDSGQSLITVHATEPFVLQANGDYLVLPDPAMLQQHLFATLQALDWDKVMDKYMGAQGFGSTSLGSDAAIAEIVNQIKVM